MINKEGAYLLGDQKLPEGWKVKKLKDISQVKGGFAFDSKKFKTFGTYQVIKMSNLYDNNLDLFRSKSFLNEGDITHQEKEYLLNKDDIIITLTGTNGKRDYGYIYQIDNEHNLLLNQRLAKITAINESPIFLFYALKSKKFLDQFFFGAIGGTGNQANVSIVFLSKIKILLPPLPEQRAIASCLSAWDKAIQLNTQLIARKELQKKWLMQQLLTGKRRLKGFEEEWKSYSYNDLLKVVKRPVSWNDSDLYNLISVRRRSGGIFLREALFGHQIKVKDLRTVEEGDFLFSKMQIVHGASTLVTPKFSGAKISGSYIAVVAKNSLVLDMHFFNWYSQLPYFYHQTYISSYGVHIEKMTFDFETFLSLGIKLPSLEEQTAITQILQSADEEIQLLKSQVDKLKEQKKGLMQVLLTGKKRLKYA